GPQAFEVRLAETGQVHARPANAVVPPQGDAVALRQLQEALEDRLLQRVAGRTAVGAGVAVGPLFRLRVGVVAERRGQVAHLAPRQRPDGRPLDFRPRVEGHRDEAVATGADVQGLALAVLALAEEQAVVEGHGGAAQLGLTSQAARLVASEHTGITLQPLAQRAGPGLRVAGALAGVHGAQVVAQLTEGAGKPGDVAPRDVNVQDAVAVRGRPLQQWHRAGDGADVVAVPGQRFLRRDHAVAPVAGVRLPTGGGAQRVTV